MGYHGCMGYSPMESYHTGIFLLEISGYPIPWDMSGQPDILPDDVRMPCCHMYIRYPDMVAGMYTIFIGF